ncbi:MAG: hypothetical protein M1814_001356 [Vezdaea aestivalis]|nr:MAG: hypothetical protein M1814_001356 [Vezdaea aestivalis]
MPPIKYILFDCDNTLVLSEELAFEACAEVANRLLTKYKIDARYTGPQLLSDFVGQNFRGMMKNLQAIHNFTITPEEEEENVKGEEIQVIATLEEKAQPCVDCMPELERVYAEKKYGLAVVSSSALRRVQASIKKVGQDKFFNPAHVYSAATSLPTPTSKPDPAVYLHACKELGVKPEECVAVEDSKSGATSAVRAGIYTIAYTGSYEGTEKQAEMADALKGCGAKVVMKQWPEFQKCLAEIEALP